MFRVDATLHRYTLCHVLLICCRVLWSSSPRCLVSHLHLQISHSCINRNKMKVVSCVQTACMLLQVATEQQKRASPRELPIWHSPQTYLPRNWHSRCALRAHKSCRRWFINCEVNVLSSVIICSTVLLEPKRKCHKFLSNYRCFFPLALLRLFPSFYSNSYLKCIQY